MKMMSMYSITLTTGINDLSDDEVKCLSKNPLHPRQKLRRLVKGKMRNEK